MKNRVKLTRDLMETFKKKMVIKEYDRDSIQTRITIEAEKMIDMGWDIRVDENNSVIYIEDKHDPEEYYRIEGDKYHKLVDSMPDGVDVWEYALYLLSTGELRKVLGYK